jgi:hypothetical protein
MDEKQVIVKVTADTADAENKVDSLQTKIDGLSATPATDSFKALKQELNDSNASLEKIGTTFGKNSVQYEAMSSHISDVTNQIKNATKASESLNPANKLQPLVDVGAKAATAVKGTANAMTGMSLATELSSTAFRGLKTAIATTGIGLLVVGVGELVAWLAKYIEKIKEGNEVQKAINGTWKDFTKGATDATVKVQEVNAAFTEYHKGLLTKKEALEKYNSTLGDTFGKTNDIRKAEKNLIDKAPDYIQMMALKAKANAEFTIAAQKSADALITGDEDQLNWFQKTIQVIKGGSNPVASLVNLATAQADAAKEKSTELNKQAKQINDDAVKNFNAALELKKKAGLKDPDFDKPDKKSGESQAEKDAKAAQALEQKIELENEKFHLSVIDKKLFDEEQYHQKNLKILQKGNQDILQEMIRHNNEVNLLEGKKKDETIDTDNLTKDALLKNAADYINPAIKLEVDKAERDREFYAASKQLSYEEKEVKLDNLNAVANATNALTDLVGQNTVAGKAFAIATTTIDTYVAAQKAYLSQFTPGNPTSPFLAYAAMAAAIIQGLANVKKIVEVKIPNAKGSGSGDASAPSVTPPSINATLLNPQDTAVKDVRVTNSTDTVVKAYISQKELTDNQNKQDFLNKLGRI